MNKEEIKELFNKYGVKHLKDKNGQSECYCCKNIKHKYSLTWTSFLYEYKEKYYCYYCLLSILLQQENQKLKGAIETYDILLKSNVKGAKVIEELEKWLKNLQEYYVSVKEKYDYSDEHKFARDVLDKLKQLKEECNGTR